MIGPDILKITRDREHVPQCGQPPTQCLMPLPVIMSGNVLTLHGQWIDQGDCNAAQWRGRGVSATVALSQATQLKWLSQEVWYLRDRLMTLIIVPSSTVCCNIITQSCRGRRRMCVNWCRITARMTRVSHNVTLLYEGYHYTTDGSKVKLSHCMRIDLVT